jgi:glycosyltransferase involved in cell wall biosynthesis
MNSRAPKCSVIIPTYNRMELLCHTLESLTRQTLPGDEFEVLVVDDGSSDGTASMVRGFQDRLRLRYFFQEDEGWRVSKARNVGIANADGDVCVFIDSGLLLHSGCLAAHVATHGSAAGPVAICGYVYGFNLDNEAAGLIELDLDVRDPDGTIELLAKKRQWLDVREVFYAKYGDDFGDLPAPWVVFWTCNVSARTEQVRLVGAFDEAFRSWGGEDLDLGYRLYLAGARLVLDRRASAIHLPHHKKYQVNEELAAVNYRYMANKYGTPISQLLPRFPDINPFTINDVIRERGLPGCVEYLARDREVAGARGRTVA